MTARRTKVNVQRQLLLTNSHAAAPRLFLLQLHLQSWSGCATVVAVFFLLCVNPLSHPPPPSDDIFPFSRVSLVSWSFCRLLSGVPLFVYRDTSRRISERTTRRSGFHGNEPFHGSIVGSRQDTRRSTPFFCLSTCPRSSNISLHYCQRSRNVETLGPSVAVSSARIDR